MPRVREAQVDFTGGMNDRLRPEQLAASQYALGKNLETRYGGIRSRRGSWRVSTPLNDSAGTASDVYGFSTYKSPQVNELEKTLIASYENNSSTTKIIRKPLRYNAYETPMETPFDYEGEVSINFVQAYDYVYAMSDGYDMIRWDGVSNSWEYVPIGTSGSAPQGRDGLYAYNRLWVIEDDDTVVASDLLDSNWDRINNEFRVEQGDGTKLVGLAKFGGGGLIAFKERGIAYISGANNFVSTSDLSMNFIDERIGCVAKRTITNIGKDIFFLGAEGVWTIDQTSEQNAQLVELPLSEPISGLIADINWSAAENASAVHFDNYYLLAIPTKGSTYADRILAFDLISRSWVGYWEFDDPDSDYPFQFYGLEIVSRAGTQYCAAIGRHGDINFLLNGEYEDFVGGAFDTFIGSGSGSTSDKTAVYQVWPTSYAGTLGTIRGADFTDGYLSFRFASTGPITSDQEVFQETASSSKIYVTSTNRIYFKMGSDWTAYVDPDKELDDRRWHNVSAYHNGTELVVVEIDGVAYTPVFSVSTDKTTWLSSLATADVRNDISLKLSYFDISSEDGEAGTTGLFFDPHRILLTFREAEGAAGTSGYFFYGTTSQYVEVTLTDQNGNDVDQKRGTDEIAYSDIESILTTRAFSFGDFSVSKSAIRGEVRFAHGQPSVTCELITDTPFDEETVASMNAKTYSLTDYEVHGQTAWTQTNANDDFATPFREDYAPVQLGTIVGTNGFKADVHRDHAEFFSTLAYCAWLQLRLTNTQGFVRYKNIKLDADAKNFTQDLGNNGN